MFYLLILASRNKLNYIRLLYSPIESPVLIVEITAEARRDLRRNRGAVAAKNTRATAGTKYPERPLCLAWAKSGERRAGSQF